MASLFGRAPKDTYKDILRIENSGVGLTSDFTLVLDGAGNSTPIHISTTDFAIHGNIWPHGTGTAGQVLGTVSPGILGWVNQTGGGGGGLQTITHYTISSDYPLTTSDLPSNYIRFEYDPGEGTTTLDVQVPDNASQPIPIGTSYVFYPAKENLSIRVVTAGGNTESVIINYAAPFLNQTRTAGSPITLIKVADNEWDLAGDLKLATGQS